MGLDYALWKWRGVPAITPGLCYLLLNEGAEIPEVQQLDTEALAVQLRNLVAAPAEGNREPAVDFQVYPEGVLIEAFASTPAEIFERLIQFARREGFCFFDAQSPEVTSRDERDLKKRMKSALAAQEKEDARRDFLSIENKARTGDLRALVDLGNRLAFGDGVAKDAAGAFKCYEAAARRGSCDGMFNLASCHRLGEGTDKDIREAIRWYERAMEKDKFFAPYALGEVYALGVDVDKNRDLAIKYFTLARENGNHDAVPQLRALGAIPPLPKDTRS